MSSKSEKPLVCVAMPVYNGEEYLFDAISSILEQTYDNIDFLIIDDGSTDNSISIINSFSDSRIRFFKNDKNRGVSYTRNRAIELAKGKYLAWMDCDDISLRSKIEKQVVYMEMNPDTAVVGTSYLRFFEKQIYYSDKAIQSYEKIKASFVFKSATIFMPTALIRISIIEKEGIKFDENLAMAEDYDFFQRLCYKYVASNLTEVLFHYRDNPTSLTKTFVDRNHDRFLLMKKIYRRILEELSISVGNDDLYNHDNCINNVMYKDFITYKNCTEHLRKIELANREHNIYDQKILKKIIKEQFFFISKKAGPVGIKTFMYYIIKSISWGYFNSFSSMGKVAVRSILKYEEFNLKNRVYKRKIKQV